jgi:xanthine dehydrogenase iron-sulfur cluster and FAD-binding subunit A
VNLGFDYLPATSIAEACDVLTEHGADARVLAGGTDLMIELRRGSNNAPRVVVDVNGVAELTGIAEVNGAVTVLPLATHADLMRSDVVQDYAPLLSAAAATIGSPQIRAHATVGGNIMNAAACADTIPPLIALGATVTLQSKAGCRDLPLAELFVKPYVTKAKPDELLTAIRFPKLDPRARGAFIKLGRRNALAISRLSVAAILEVGTDGTITEARIVPGSAFPTWQRVTEAEQILLGEKPGVKLFAAVGHKVSEEMIKATGRRWSTEYKEPVIAVLVRRALEQCALGAPRAPSAQAGGALRRAPRFSKLPGSAPASRTSDAAQRSARPTAETCITTTINGRPYALRVPANTTLLDLLRDHLGLTGTKCGCEIGECGACTVLLDGQAVNSCLVLAPQIDGREVLTVEGLAQNGKLHPLQEAFLDHDAVHCGFCTPGMLMSAKALLDWNPRATEPEIRNAISGNLCRCTGYQQIVEAIAKAPSL